MEDKNYQRFLAGIKEEVEVRDNNIEKDSQIFFGCLNDKEVVIKHSEEERKALKDHSNKIYDMFKKEAEAKLKEALGKTGDAPQKEKDHFIQRYMTRMLDIINNEIRSYY